MSGEFDDIVDFCIALEVQAARLAACRRKDTELMELRAAITDLEQADARVTFLRADGKFHTTLAGASGNVRLRNAIELVRAEMFATYDMLPYEDLIAAPTRDRQPVYRAVYEAVSDGHVDRAAKAMREHTVNTLAQLREIVFRVEELTGTGLFLRDSEAGHLLKEYRTDPIDVVRTSVV